jgi:hypothetical protein
MCHPMLRRLLFVLFPTFLLLASCTAAPDSEVTPLAVPEVHETEADSIWWFRLSDYAKSNTSRFKVDDFSRGWDTVLNLYTPLDSTRDSMAEWSLGQGTMKFVGYQILNPSGGLLFQQGWTDTSFYTWRYSKPFYSVPPVLRVYAFWHPRYVHSGREIFDSIPVEVCSLGGHCVQGTHYFVTHAELVSWDGNDSCVDVWTSSQYVFPTDTSYSGFSGIHSTYCPRKGLVETQSRGVDVRTRLFR